MVVMLVTRQRRIMTTNQTRHPVVKEVSLVNLVMY